MRLHTAVIVGALLFVSSPALAQCVLCSSSCSCAGVQTGKLHCVITVEGGSCTCNAFDNCDWISGGGGGGEEDGFKRPNPGSALPVGGEEPVLVWSALYELPGNSLGRGARGQVLRGVGRDDFDATKNAVRGMVNRGAVSVMVGIVHLPGVFEAKVPSGRGYLLRLDDGGTGVRLSVEDARSRARLQEGVVREGDFLVTDVEVDGRSYLLVVGASRTGATTGPSFVQRHGEIVEAARSETVGQLAPQLSVRRTW